MRHACQRRAAAAGPPGRCPAALAGTSTLPAAEACRCCRSSVNCLWFKWSLSLSQPTCTKGVPAASPDGQTGHHWLSVNTKHLMTLISGGIGYGSLAWATQPEGTAFRRTCLYMLCDNSCKREATNRIERLCPRMCPSFGDFWAITMSSRYSTASCWIHVYRRIHIIS